MNLLPFQSCRLNTLSTNQILNQILKYLKEVILFMTLIYKLKIINLIKNWYIYIQDTKKSYLHADALNWKFKFKLLLIDISVGNNKNQERFKT